MLDNFTVAREYSRNHRRSQGGPNGAPLPPNFLENTGILSFERRFSKQNSVIRLKSNILAPQNFWSGYATARNSVSLGRIDQSHAQKVSGVTSPHHQHTFVISRSGV